MAKFIAACALLAFIIWSYRTIKHNARIMADQRRLRRHMCYLSEKTKAYNAELFEIVLNKSGRTLEELQRDMDRIEYIKNCLEENDADLKDVLAEIQRLDNLV